MSSQSQPQKLERRQSMKLQRPDMSGFRPPKAPLARFLWRCKIWADATFVTGMLEPWETFLLLSIFFLFFSLVIGGAYRYLPNQVSFIAGRARYYLIGTDSWTPPKEQ